MFCEQLLIINHCPGIILGNNNCHFFLGCIVVGLWVCCVN